MPSAWKQSAAAVFFCSYGLVCSNPAIAAESTEPASSSQRPSQGDPTFKPATGILTDTEGAIKEGEAPLPAGQSVKVGSFGQVDLHVKDLDLSMVLQLLSIQSQRNIVASRNVSGTITADLYNVDFYEALDAVLHTNGFGYKEKGNFIYVYTQAELDAMEKAERRMVSRIVRLNYITAAEALAFVTPLISERGSIAASGAASTGFQPSLSDAGANSRADADTLVIRDYPDNVSQIVDIIKQLDIRPKQVLVEATILRARLTENNAFGVDLTFLGDFALDQFTSPLGAVDELISGAVKEPPGGGTGGGASTTVGGTAVPNSGIKVGVVSNSISAFITALDSVTDTTVMANPKIMVLNRQKADLLVGQRLGYLSSTSTDTSTTQTVEFLDVGTQLTLRPFVSDDGFIRMELRPSLSDGETRTVGAGASTFVIPDQSTQELTTNVMVRNGQTIVLGGLFKEDTTVSRNQVPGLGDVPVLGLAFKGQDDSVTREEVIFLVTPTIVKDESLYAAGERAKDSANLALLGSREGLLPWSRTKLTTSHMREAQKALDAGDREKALWSVDLALGLNPTLVEARRMKEELTGQREYVFSRSLIKDALDHVIAEEMLDIPVPTPAPEATPEAEAVPAVEAPAVPEAAPEVQQTPAEDATGDQSAAPQTAVTESAQAQDAQEAAVIEAMQQWVENATQEEASAAPIANENLPASEQEAGQISDAAEFDAGTAAALDASPMMDEAQVDAADAAAPADDATASVPVTDQQ